MRTNGRTENKDTLYWEFHKEGLTNFTTINFFEKKGVGVF
jgi:hypothetical protein